MVDRTVAAVGCIATAACSIGFVLAWACGAVPPPKPNECAAACCAAGAGDAGEGLAVPPKPNGLLGCCCAGVAPPPPNANPVAGAPPLAPPNGVAGNADGKHGEGPLAIVRFTGLAPKVHQPPLSRLAHLHAAVAEWSPAHCLQSAVAPRNSILMTTGSEQYSGTAFRTLYWAQPHALAPNICSYCCGRYTTYTEWPCMLGDCDSATALVMLQICM